MKINRSPPVALTIAGSDNSAGAGAQADLKTFAAQGVYGLTAITCVVAEIPGRVSAIQAVDEKIVAQQISLSLANYPVAAVKTGLLCTKKIIEIVAASLEKSPAPLVVDPVMVATSGDPLLEPEAVELYKTLLFPRASLVTPNLDEARTLLGREIRGIRQMRVAARDLSESFGCPILLKGGHLRGTDAIDVLFRNGNSREFSAPFVMGVHTHGTGCTYSSAITAGIARGLDLERAIEQAKKFVTRAIATHFRWNAISALNHSARK
ncbi:MAG: bifunctional hydroxymethylpyrimidine kinase/phosphomethylpyrimidine kinase [Verrucomicrobiota bacterium]|nr:bifunctional hydroxymethylpyrimidine kinase/phosphomethylpyrimidine kinase [Verrucomicrobiota bacterium]